MKNIKIKGKLIDAKKVYYFKTNLIKLKVQIQYGQGRQISTIIYAPTENRELLSIPKNTFICIHASLQVRPHYTRKDRVKEFVIFYLKDWEVLDKEEFTNSIEINGIIEGEPEYTEVNGKIYARFPLGVNLGKNKNKSLMATCRNASARLLKNFKVGDEVHIIGYFKTVRHHMQIQSKDFEFDTFEVAVHHFIQK